MENEKTETLCEQVRKHYGDTQQEFAVRLGIAASTVKLWEKKGLPQKSAARALLVLAQRTDFPATPPRFEPEVEAMTEQQIVRYLMEGYGDTAKRFARRIGVNYGTVSNWANGTFKNTAVARRLLRHVMEFPGDFADVPAAFPRQNG